MSRGMPSMTALLGLLALAGYQNRTSWRKCFKTRELGIPSPAPAMH